MEISPGCAQGAGVSLNSRGRPQAVLAPRREAVSWSLGADSSAANLPGRGRGWNYTNRIFPTGGEHMKRKDHQDTCDHCGVPISGGDSWLGLCGGCESEMTKDPTKRGPVRPLTRSQVRDRASCPFFSFESERAPGGG